MKAVIQRVNGAALRVADRTVCEIGKGLVVYLGVESGDVEADIPPFCAKIAALRIFADGNGKMNRSVNDIGGEILLVPNFTLCADTSHGNRPDFFGAMKPDGARTFFDACVRELGRIARVSAGVFGADMTIDQSNDGPVTIIY
ncbi:MAG: D-aminoacyl-tRNA deacylase [Roseburia sp.]|nr:D-aminoacyl-tRNA deacylase [Roseburia sp.]